ncbi:MAG: DUF2207 domain-containing protein, partial [Bacilli bacterium]|nr:DUF2207 domain-containing protein [Bacilli bacterium]
FYAINALNILWLIGLIIILIRVYKKYDREEISTFKEKYFREFPANYGPETLDYLLNKNITTKGLTASVLELIRRKHLKIERDNKKDYKLILNINDDTDLSDSEKYLKNWLINEIGNGEEITIKQINKVSTNQMTASKFIKNYEKWQELIKENNQDKEFFKDNTKVKIKSIVYVVLTSLITLILNIVMLNNVLLAIIIMIGSVLAITYLITFKTRTTKGNEDYVRWQAFKRFLNDFGNFDDKDLPEIVLWEKYLVFASVLGVAKKLEKVMRIKLTNMDVSSDIMDNYTFFHYHHGISGADFNTSLSNSIGRSISSAVTSSRATLGSGGGSSSGGGGFGGGGGGGRF